MIFNEIIHGTQYYRSPTPLQSEWEGDIARMEEFNIDAFQIRINWRTNERLEGVYDFSDVDEVMALAEKYNRKVIMKIQLECAPQYVFDKYDGVRIGAKGEKLYGAYHGAFYGGWRPCFTNPMVQERAKLFVEQVAKRYAGRKNIILWNAWNEIRNRPIEDCFCPHCRKAFGKYLQNKFGTIEKLNEFYGAEEESFDTIHLPAMAHGFWDM
ncbi:MAG: beta-galactosidase [Clostridia bacterium]|nr:beta-galactosidase [Clostridia bacterium]